MSKKKYNFTLKVNPDVIDSKYSITPKSNITNINLHETTNITPIDKIHGNENQLKTFSFIDNNQNHYVSMIDSISKQQIQRTHCFWCRHPFTHYPIGCPIEYVYNKIIKVHVSEVTKEKYLSQHKYLSNQKPNDETHFVPNNYYKTDGCFCSFNCCIAFINDNIHNPLYKHSKHLLMKMYVDIFKKEPSQNIVPTPSWRILEQYGGWMTIDEFRNSCSNYIYIDTTNHVHDVPNVVPIGKIFKEHIIF